VEALIFFLSTLMRSAYGFPDLHVLLPQLDESATAKLENMLVPYQVLSPSSYQSPPLMSLPPFSRAKTTSLYESLPVLWPACF
jgi:hypothetical protein